MSYRINIEPYKIKDLPEDDQIEIMRNWFYDNYQDPEEECPYDSEDGDYVYIWGGPYSAVEELECEFGEYVNNDLIKKLTDELEEHCYEWSAISSPDLALNETFSEWPREFEKAIERFNHNISLVEKLLVSINENDGILKFMIHAYCISILEAFLSEEFIYRVLSNEAYLQKLFENVDDDFNKKKIPISDVFSTMRDIKKLARGYLTKIIWHNLKKVGLLYKNVLGIEIPKDIGFLYNEIYKRHDIIHRCGKNKEGTEITVSKTDIMKLIDEIKRLVNYVNSKTDKILF